MRADDPDCPNCTPTAATTVSLAAATTTTVKAEAVAETTNVKVLPSPLPSLARETVRLYIGRCLNFGRCRRATPIRKRPNEEITTVRGKGKRPL